MEQHFKRLENVFQCLRAANVRLKPKKCVFLADKINFLGHVISRDGIATCPEKCAEIQEWPQPESKKQVQSFLGMCAYYQNFIPKFSELAAPLYRLTAEGTEFSWGESEKKSFQGLKAALCSPDVMTFPDFSPDSGEFILDTDASSDVGLGAVLSQRQADGQEKVIAYGSRIITSAERNYCTTRLELLAIVHFVKKYRYYLLGKSLSLEATIRLCSGWRACGMWRDSVPAGWNCFRIMTLTSCIGQVKTMGMRTLFPVSPGVVSIRVRTAALAVRYLRLAL